MKVMKHLRKTLTTKVIVKETENESQTLSDNFEKVFIFFGCIANMKGEIYILKN